eukprot:5176971-Pyramimonas_sp.AAC.1
MTNDGITRATTALAMHALALLPSGEAEVLGVRAGEILILEGAHIHEQWNSFLNPDAPRDAVADEERDNLVIIIGRAERATKPMP